MKTKVLIVGGGFAGAATAAALSAYKHFDITLIEAEKVHGVHSSGRNASMVRRVIEDPILSKLACMSVDGIRQLEAEHNVQLIERRGGLLIGQSSEISSLHSSAAQIPQLAKDMSLLHRAELASRVDVLQTARSSVGIATSDCGVADIHALLSHYLLVARRGGVECLTNHRLSAIEVIKHKVDRKSTRLNSSHSQQSRMPSSA